MTSASPPCLPHEYNNVSMWPVLPPIWHLLVCVGIITTISILRGFHHMSQTVEVDSDVAFRLSCPRN